MPKRRHHSASRSSGSIANARIRVLLTPPEKARIVTVARSAGLSVGALMRRAALAYRPEGDTALLDSFLGQVQESTRRAEAALDRALDNVAASRKRLARLDRQRAQ